MRLGVLLAYRQKQDPAIATFLNDSDAFIVREASEAINDTPIERRTPRWPASSPAHRPPTRRWWCVHSMPTTGWGDATRARALANYSLDEKATPEMRSEALAQLALWGKTPQRDRVVGIYRPMKSRPADDAVAALGPAASKLLGARTPEAVQLAAVDAVSALGLRAATPELVAAVSNPQLAASVRSAALKSLDGFGGKEVLAALDAAEKSDVPSLRLTALQIVAHRDPERALPMIKRFAANGSVEEQRAAFQSLGQLQSPQAPALLIGALDQLAAGKVQPGAQVELLDVIDKSESPEVKTRWAQQQADWGREGRSARALPVRVAGRRCRTRFAAVLR